MGCEGVPVLSKCRCMRDSGDLQGGLEEAERVLGYAGVSQGDDGDS